MSTAVPLVVEAEAGDFIWFGAGLFTFKVTSEQSGGAYIVIEDEMSRGKTTPFHVHPGHDETTYLLEGEILYNLDGVERQASAGATISIPRGTPHALLVTSASAKLVAFVNPGNAEAFYRAAGEAAPGRIAPPEGTPMDVQRIVAAGKSTGFMHVLGPPPFDRTTHPSTSTRD